MDSSRHNVAVHSPEFHRSGIAGSFVKELQQTQVDFTAHLPSGTLGKGGSG
jgi:hypothetical protein